MAVERMESSGWREVWKIRTVPILSFSVIIFTRVERAPVDDSHDWRRRRWRRDAATSVCRSGERLHWFQRRETRRRIEFGLWSPRPSSTRSLGKRKRAENADRERWARAAGGDGTKIGVIGSISASWELTGGTCQTETPGDPMGNSRLSSRHGRTVVDMHGVVDLERFRGENPQGDNSSFFFASQGVL